MATNVTNLKILETVQEVKAHQNEQDVKLTIIIDATEEHRRILKGYNGTPGLGECFRKLAVVVEHIQSVQEKDEANRKNIKNRWLDKLVFPVFGAVVIYLIMDWLPKVVAAVNGIPTP